MGDSSRVARDKKKYANTTRGSLKSSCRRFFTAEPSEMSFEWINNSAGFHLRPSCRVRKPLRRRLNTKRGMPLAGKVEERERYATNVYTYTSTYTYVYIYGIHVEVCIYMYTERVDRIPGGGAQWYCIIDRLSKETLDRESSPRTMLQRYIIYNTGSGQWEMKMREKTARPVERRRDARRGVGAFPVQLLGNTAEWST